MTLNCCILQGRMCADPELKTTPNGTNVTQFSIAVKQGKDDTEFVDIVSWKQTAEFITKYFHKGDPILLRGYLRVRRYDDKNGNRRKVIEVCANEAYFCGGRADEATRKPDLNVKADEAVTNVMDTADFTNMTDAEPLPF